MVDSNLQLLCTRFSRLMLISFKRLFSYFIIVQIDEMDNANFIVDKCLSSGQ